MLYESLRQLCQEVNQYLKIQFQLKEDIAFLSSVKNSEQSFSTNRVSISLMGWERETSAGISFQRKKLDNHVSGTTAPAWQVSMNVLISVVFQDKHYDESLYIFSSLVAFVQKNNLIRSNTGNPFSLEPINLSVSELSNLWSICGENYYPSLFCKLRMLVVDESETIDFSYLVSQPHRETKIKGDGE